MGDNFQKYSTSKAKDRNDNRSSNLDLVFEIEITDSLAKLIREDGDFMTKKSQMEVTIGKHHTRYDSRQPESRQSSEIPLHNIFMTKNELIKCNEVLKPKIRNNQTKRHSQTKPMSGSHSIKKLPTTTGFENDANILWIGEHVYSEVIKLIAAEFKSNGEAPSNENNLRPRSPHQNSLQDEIPEKDQRRKLKHNSSPLLRFSLGT